MLWTGPQNHHTNGRIKLTLVFSQGRKSSKRFASSGAQRNTLGITTTERIVLLHCRKFCYKRNPHHLLEHTLITPKTHTSLIELDNTPIYVRNIPTICIYEGDP